MPDRLPFVVQPMRLSDLDQVIEIERTAFSSPWSARAYRYEIQKNEHSTMLVVRPAPHPGGCVGRGLRSLKRTQPGPVLGYGGFWLLVDEAHIATIAVHPEWRRRGLGELLLLTMLERAAEQDAQRATLEVRVSNTTAQSLYTRYGFSIVSLQRRYYADNNEDAFIMITPPFDSPGFVANLDHCRTQLYASLLAGGTHARQHLTANGLVRQNPTDRVQSEQSNLD
ncbi:MAG: ribosomal protein S18-alanine N-acetyltransferase [Anaerolineae bacterium]